MRILVLALFCLFLTNELPSQNLIPNGSFELVKKPIDENITGSRKGFDSKVHAWYSPTNVSPDIYLPHPNNANFSDHFRKPNPKKGKHYIGLIIDNPYDRCKTYREYVQVKLKDTLEIGSTYRLEFWINPDRNDIYNLGVFFDKKKLVNDKCSMLLNTPQLSFEDSLVSGKWENIIFEITPSQPYTHITVGNFEQSDDLKRRYCYFDDFRLWKKGTAIEGPTDSINIENKIPETNIVSSSINSPSLETIFNANNVQFEHSKSNLTSASLLELDHLISYLKAHPSLKILIEGHTDNSGTDLVNQQLSTERVKSVMAYMREHGVTPDRMKYISHGASQPIASNDTEEGRRLNRRVTFLMMNEK